MKLTICLQDQVPVTRHYREGVKIREIADEMQKSHPYRIVLARIDGHVTSLNRDLSYGGKLELLDIRDPGARMTYQSSLLLLYIKAVHDVAGKDVSVRINNSLSKGLHTTVKGVHVTDEFTTAVEARMRELVQKAVEITKQTYSRDSFRELMKQHKRERELERLNNMPDVQNIDVFRLEEELMMSSYELVPDTGYIDLFEVMEYRHGVLVRFPHQSNPSVILPFEEQQLLYDAFSEETRWCKLTGVYLSADLNRSILDGSVRDLIFMNEALHEKKITEIAEAIAESKKRIILIAGPSSSGKTTFANRLCIQLRVAGLNPLYIGTDDYFIDRDDLKKGPDGEYDFEGLDALDRDLLNRDMQALIDGKTVDIPYYNFKTGAKEFGKRITSIDSSQPIVIEGIHSLNPVLTEQISDDEKFRIYISPLTQLNIDHYNRIPTTDARKLRRIVRDAQFRGYSAAQTIHMWPKVSRGEDKNIFPYNDLADMFFNSQCIYELAVLKKYAKPQLEIISDDQPEYPEAQRLLKLLSYFVTLENDELIPNNSIIREFIGGSVIV
jgi:uridine kinase